MSRCDLCGNAPRWIYRVGKDEICGACCANRLAEARVESAKLREYEEHTVPLVTEQADTITRHAQRIVELRAENAKLREELDEIISMRDAAESHVIRLRAENAKLRESDAANQRAAAYWCVQYYAAKGMAAPTPCSTDSAWEKVLEGACKAEQEIASLRAELAALRAAPRKLVEWRNNTTPEALPYRVENHQPATVEAGEWRSDFKPTQLG